MGRHGARPRRVQRGNGVRWKHFSVFQQNTGLLQPNLLQKHLPLLKGLQFGNISFGGGSNNEHFGVFLLYGRSNGINILVALKNRTFVNVAHVKHGFIGKQHEVAHELAVLLVELKHSSRLALLQ